MTRHSDSPEAAYEAISEIQDELELLGDDYSEAFQYVHDKGDRPTDEQDKRVSTSSVSDPTALIVGDPHPLSRSDDNKPPHRGQASGRKKLKQIAEHDLPNLYKRVQHLVSKANSVYRTQGAEWMPLSAHARATTHSMTQERREGLAMKDKRRLQARKARLERQLSETEAALNQRRAS